MSREIHREKLRSYLKDSEALNRLLNFEKENSDEFLDLYLDMSVMALNTMPPLVVSISLEDENPFGSLIVHQAAIEALVSNSIVAARNDLTYNNGGVTVKVDDGQRYMAILQNLYRLADRELEMFRKWKIAINIDGGWGGIPSPYSYYKGYGNRSNILI